MTYAPVIPFTNVRLLKVEGGGFKEDHGQPAGNDNPKWTGDVGAFLSEEILTDVNGDRLDEVQPGRLSFPASLNIDIKRGDTVTYRQDGVDVPREVRNIEDKDINGIVRLTFVTK